VTDEQGFDLRIISGSPTPEELAALTAVLAAVVDELADGEARSLRPPVTAWQRSQRSLRRPLAPGFGAWRSFSG